jgi:anti-anti-sigma factor
LRLIIDAGATDLICDISALTYMDSTGLSIFLAAHKRHEGTGGHFIVLAPMPQVKRLFAVAGIEPFLDVRSNSS